MKPWENAIRSHPMLWYLAAAVFAVFLSCFSFPVWNFTRAWSPDIRRASLFNAFLGYGYLAFFLSVLFPRRRAAFLLLVNALTTCAGLGCRFLLEFGEVSNTYNFTSPNLLAHALVSVGYCTLLCLGFARYRARTAARK